MKTISWPQTNRRGLLYFPLRKLEYFPALTNIALLLIFPVPFLFPFLKLQTTKVNTPSKFQKHSLAETEKEKVKPHTQ